MTRSTRNISRSALSEGIDVGGAASRVRGQHRTLAIRRDYDVQRTRSVVRDTILIERTLLHRSSARYAALWSIKLQSVATAQLVFFHQML